MKLSPPVVAWPWGPWRCAAGRGSETTGLWLASLLGLGGVWFVRNPIAFGNPIPAAHVDLGPLSLPSPPLTKLTFTVAHYFGQPGVWGKTSSPDCSRPRGLRGGPCWARR